MPFTARPTLAAVALAFSLTACSEADGPTASLEPGAALAAKAPKDPKGPKEPREPREPKEPKEPKGGGKDDDDGGAGQRKVTICHVGDDDAYVLLTVGAPGAANHLSKHAGDLAATLQGGSYGCPTAPAR